jgi:hypothetical protein
MVKGIWVWFGSVVKNNSDKVPEMKTLEMASNCRINKISIPNLLRQK